MGDWKTKKCGNWHEFGHAKTSFEVNKFCVTFSPVTPLFLLISGKLMSSATKKCNLVKILSDHF